MAIILKSGGKPGGKPIVNPKREMTVEEFKQWLKGFDTNGDGFISREELRGAIRSLGKRFTSWKSRRGIHAADSNHNGLIDDDDEIRNLVVFANTSLGMKIAVA